MRKNVPLKIIVPTLFLTLFFTGCSLAPEDQTNSNENENQNENTNINVNQNVNENQNTNQDAEIDTSDWLTYENEEYGFKIKYPGDGLVDELSTEEVFIKNIDNGQIKIYIQSYNKAPEEDGLLYSKSTLESLKQSLNTNPKSETINDILMIPKIEYDVPGSSFLYKASFFINNDYIEVTYPLSIYGESYKWPQDKLLIQQKIEQIEQGNTSVAVENQIKLFDTVLRSIKLL